MFKVSACEFKFYDISATKLGIFGKRDNFLSNDTGFTEIDEGFQKILAKNTNHFFEHAETHYVL